MFLEICQKSDEQIKIEKELESTEKLVNAINKEKITEKMEAQEEMAAESINIHQINEMTQKLRKERICESTLLG